MRAFLSAMLERKEERRATAKHLLNHLFIQENVLAAATDASPAFPDYKKYLNSCLKPLFANPVGPPSRRP